MTRACPPASHSVPPAALCPPIAGALALLLAAACGPGGGPAVEFEDEVRQDERGIVGGSNTSIVSHPWQVSLQSRFGSHFCGGSILSDRWILTAAHCVDGDSPSALRVVAGTTRLSTASSGQSRAVDQIIVYPGYTDPADGKDAALLRLAAPLDLNGETTRAIPIVGAQAASAGVTAPGTLATVTGWGRLASGSSSLPDVLQAVSVPIVSNAQAQQAYSNETITADQLAAGVFGVGGKDACQGDSGGPLTVPTSEGTALAGIVSWGYGCADPAYPGMYGRVSAFEGWILANAEATVALPGTDPQPDPEPDPQPDPEPGQLLSQTGLSGASGSWAHFPITVPQGAATLSVQMSGGLGDADLYVRQGSQPTTSAYTCRPYLYGNQESCALNDPAPGLWYVSVRGYSTFSGVSLEAGVALGGSEPPPPPPSGPLLEETGLSGDRGQWVRFEVNVPASAGAVLVTISGGTGDADLYVRAGAAPTASSYDCRPYVAGNQESCEVSAAGGTLYIGVHGYAAFSGVTLTATAAGGGAEPSGPVVLLDEDDLGGAASSWTRFQVTVPAGSSTLTVATTGGTGDADLYVRAGAAPTATAYDCRPYAAGNQETCTVQVSGGVVHIAVVGYRAYAGVTLTAVAE